MDTSMSMPQSTETSFATQNPGPVGVGDGDVQVAELRLFLKRDDQEPPNVKERALWVVFARVIIENRDSDPQKAHAKLLVGNVTVDEVDVTIPGSGGKDPCGICLSLQAAVNLTDDLLVEFMCSGYSCIASQISMIALNVAGEKTETQKAIPGGRFQAQMSTELGGG